MPKTKPQSPKSRIPAILTGLHKLFPEAECALIHDGPFQLLAATILSAQCTDKRVNSVTPTLFAKYPDAFALAAGSQVDVEQIIKSLGFFRAKANNLRLMAQGLVDRFEGQVPQNLDDLVQLAGVGRKTANVVLGTAFGIPSGVVVDTHVQRLTHRLGLTKATTPVAIEQDLIQLLPQSEWIGFSHRLILHGRDLCPARKPKCPQCPLAPLCPKLGVDYPTNSGNGTA